MLASPFYCLILKGQQKVKELCISQHEREHTAKAIEEISDQAIKYTTVKKNTLCIHKMHMIHKSEKKNSCDGQKNKILTGKLRTMCCALALLMWKKKHKKHVHREKWREKGIDMAVTPPLSLFLSHLP